MELQEKVLSIMQKATKPLKTGEIAVLAGIEKKDAEKAVRLLSRAEKIYSPARCQWQVK
ncbi:MAG: transcriptional regulator [Bacteroidales bacterium]|nr:transcriptional regulator [Bacteroidales bacterium]